MYDYGHLLLENTGRNICVVWSDNTQSELEVILLVSKKLFYRNCSIKIERL